MKILELENEPLGKLRAIAKSLNIPNANRLKKETLAMMIREAEAQKQGIATAALRTPPGPCSAPRETLFSDVRRIGFRTSRLLAG